MTVLVTGAGGFIGRRLVETLGRAGEPVTGWTRKDVDLRDGAAVAAAMEAVRPATIFHLASAGVGAARAHDPLVIAEDVAMTAALLAAAPRGSRLVMTGSMAEYGRGGRHREDDRCDPRTAYAIARLAAGSLALAYAETHGLVVTVARLYGVYGPGEGPRRLFPRLIDDLSAGRPAALSDGTQRRDFIHLDDVCRALIALADIADGTAPPIVNIGTGRAVSVREVAEWVADALGAPRALLQFGSVERSPGDQDLLEANVERLAGLVGGAPPQRLGPGLAIELFTQGAVDPPAPRS
jgi:nucleoside-diphosphate-sugar epimerase